MIYMEDIVVAILNGGELITDLCATVYERVSSDDETSKDGREQSPTDEVQ